MTHWERTVGWSGHNIDDIDSKKISGKHRGLIEEIKLAKEKAKKEINVHGDASAWKPFYKNKKPLKNFFDPKNPTKWMDETWKDLEKQKIDKLKKDKIMGRYLIGITFHLTEEGKIDYYTKSLNEKVPLESVVMQLKALLKKLEEQYNYEFNSNIGRM